LAASPLPPFLCNLLFSLILSISDHGTGFQKDERFDWGGLNRYLRITFALSFQMQIDVFITHPILFLPLPILAKTCISSLGH
jgi:hypothetical protein